MTGDRDPSATGRRGPSAGARDPRTIITPEAFSIAPDLLGLPLASPSRRLAAILIDLVVIGIIYVVTRSFFLVFFLVVAALLLRASYRGLRGSDFIGTAFRMSVGCLGAVILLATVVAFLALRDGDRPAADGGGDDTVRDTALDGSPNGSPEGAADVPTDGPPLDTVASGLHAGAGAPLDTASGSEPPAAGPSGPPSGPGVASAPESAAAPAAAWRVWSGWRDTAGPDAKPPPDVRAARDLFLTELARDTLGTLAERLDREEERARDLGDDLERERRRTAELREEAGGGFLGRLRDLVDELGFGFGWAALYFTLVTPWTGGRTVGKRLLGLRVVQLDGSPINWWEAFERAGGYAAGFATGLLGFAQVYWDPNRQAIHDKIAGTVVVRDGLPSVPGPWRRRAPDPGPSSPDPHLR